MDISTGVFPCAVVDRLVEEASLLQNLICGGVVGASFSLLAATITMDDDGPADYAMIKEAVDAASEGDTVLVKAGTYHESNIHLKEGMVLQGEGADKTFIGGEFEYTQGLIFLAGDPLPVVWDLPNPPKFPDVPALKHVKIDGFTLSSQSRRGQDGVPILVGYRATPTVTRNRLVNSAVGIAFDAYDPEVGLGILNGNTITGNEFGIVITAQPVWPIRDLDMRWNWWGTTDGGEIAKTLVGIQYTALPPITGVIYQPWLTELVTDFAEQEGVHYNNI